MNNEELFDLLKKNGLSERESKVYLVLLENPNLTPTQIHNLVWITRTKIYEVLSSLLSKDLIAEELIGKKKVYHILNPETAFNSIISRKENELTSFKQNNKKLVSLTAEIYKEAVSRKSPFSKLEHLSDPATITNRCNYYISSAKNELLIFSKPPYVAASGELDVELDDNVRIRNIQEYQSEDNPDVDLPIPENNPKDELRFIDELPLKLIIIDSRVTILALGNNGSKVGELNTIFLDEPIIALFMKEIFESRWKKGISREEFRKSIT